MKSVNKDAVICFVCGKEFPREAAVIVFVKNKKYYACPGCGSTNRSRIFKISQRALSV